MIPFSIRFVRGSLALVALAVALPASAEARRVRSSIVVLHDVSLGDGTTTDELALTVFRAGRRSCRNDGTLVAIPGFTFNAGSLEPLADALLDSRGRRAEGFCRIVAIDLPGHGLSSTPPGYAELTMDDYVSVLEDVLGRLPRRGLAGDTLMGHSMGGALLWMLEQRLSDEGTSIARELGITELLLVAPTPPAEVDWFFGDVVAPGVLPLVLSPEGTVLPPEPIWTIDGGFYFQNVDNAPPVASTLAPDNEELAPWLSAEPADVASQLVGSALVPGAPDARPSADAGVLASRGRGRGRCRVRVVGYENDALMSPPEIAAIYQHLTGDDSKRCLTQLPGPEAIHELHVADPERFVRDVLDARGPRPGRGQR